MNTLTAHGGVYVLHNNAGMGMGVLGSVDGTSVDDVGQDHQRKP